MVDDRNVFLDKLFGNRHAEYQVIIVKVYNIFAYFVELTHFSSVLHFT